MKLMGFSKIKKKIKSEKKMKYSTLASRRKRRKRK
jgi:hypothetical protein